MKRILGVLKRTILLTVCLETALLAYGQTADTVSVYVPLTDKDSAWLQNNLTIYKRGLQTPERRAMHALLYVAWQDKCRQDLTESEKQTDHCISYFQRHHSPYLAPAYFYKGRIQLYRNSYEEAYDYYLKAEENALQNGQKDSDLLGKIYSDMGHVHYMQGNNAAARDKYLCAIEYNRSNNNIIASSINHLAISRIYSAEDNYPEAIRIVQNVISTTSDSAVLGMAWQDLGSIYWYMQENDSALYYLRKSLSYPTVHYNIPYLYYAISGVFYEEEVFDSALYYVKQALLQESVTISITSACYEILGNIAEMQGDADKALYYAKLQATCNDSLTNIIRQNKAVVLEQIDDLEKHVSGQQKGMNMLWIGIGCIAVCVILLFGYYRWKGTKQLREYVALQKQWKKLLYEKQLLENNTQQLESAHAQQHKMLLQTKEQTLLEKCEALIAVHTEPIKHRLSELKELYQHQPEYSPNKAIKRAYDDCLHLSSQTEFEQFIDAEFNGLARKVRTNYPKVQDRDLQLLVLMLLKTGNKDIAELLYLSYTSIGNLKLRLANSMHFANVNELRMALLKWICQL